MDQQQMAATDLVEEASQEFVGQWNRLVSTTNWEKGRIIFHWRQALIDADAPPPAYSDDAWSRQIGNVSGQHVGRLRRVYERFGHVRNDFPGLYWSHFQAALDWNDAEMWLEGAVQNRWSISQMRQQRWEVLGRPAGEQLGDEGILAAEQDEDASDERTDAERRTGVPHTVRELDQGPDYSQGPDFGDEPTHSSTAIDPGVPFDPDPSRYPGNGEAETVRPFENLPELPADLSEAFESFKLCILRHKLSGWNEVPCSDVLLALDALKQLATAPAGDA